MPELDFFVLVPTFPASAGLPVAGDNVLYSTRPFVSTTSGRPPLVGAVQSGERGCKGIHGWIEADQNSTIKVQGWDVPSGTWITLSTIAGTAGTTVDIDVDFPGGDFQIVANFVTPPTVWRTPKKWRLSSQNR